MNPFAFLASLFRRKPATVAPANASPPQAATLAEMIARVAESQIGVREVGNNEGKTLSVYWTATNYGDGTKDHAPWCAAFVCWCVMRAIALMGIVAPFVRPKTAAAFGFAEWARGQRGRGVSIVPRGELIKRGDIVEFSSSHVGVAVADSKPGAPVSTVDGNTNDDGSREGREVMRRTRKRSAIRAVVRVG